MTTTDMPTDTPPPAPPRVLRRSRRSRVAAGVSGGLGDYFGVDPVLFRVGFATSAFFGGAGILAYLVAWAAIPEEGTQRAPLDGFIRELRRRNVPPWLVAVAIGVALWAVAFSWWAPGPFVPVVAVVVVLTVIFGRRDMQGRSGVATAPVDLTKHAPQSQPATEQPTWVTDARTWWDDARRVSRERRRRALPVKIATLAGLAATLVTLAIVDAATGIAIPVYFWTVLGFVVAGVLVGLVLRRTPWSITGLLPVTVAGLVAFAGTHASLHDGVGTRTWTPTTRPASQYRLAFGQGVLDLRSLPPQAEPRTVRITGGAGQFRVLVPAAANVAVDADVHIGQVDVRGRAVRDTGNGGVAVERSVPAPADATGARITLDVHLADGHVDIVRG